MALACLDFGQRVQKSVFECSVTEMQYEEVMRGLEVVEVRGEEELSRLDTCPRVGLEPEYDGGELNRVADRNAVYRDLARQLSR